MNISQITAHLQGVITLPSVRLALVTVTTYLWLVAERVKIRCNLDFSLLSMNRKISLVPFQDMEFAQNYTNPPIVLLTAKHSTSGQDSAASECNGIESWEEVGLWPFHKDWRISTADFLITLRLFSLFWFYFFSLQFITNTSFRMCVKELFIQRFDPLTVSYAVLPGNGVLTNFVK